MIKIIDPDKCPAHPMDNDRGETVHIVNTELGTENLDIHINRLRPGGPNGRLHRHTNSDNVYLVRTGEGRLIAEGKTYTIRQGQIVFIPAGVDHSLSNVSDAMFEILEIYAPAGRKYDFEFLD
jgi:uncharacterized cupin superfamily protein